MLLFIPLVLLLAMAYLFNQMLDHDPSAMELARQGKPIPGFQLEDLLDADSNRTVTDLPDHAYLLNVWATWCPSCRHEHDMLVKLAESGVPIVGLNYKDNREAALKWLENLGNPYQLSVYDAEGRLGLDLGVYGAPETYVVNAEGIILCRHVGVVDERVWQNKLARLLRPESSLSASDLNADCTLRNSGVLS